LGEMNIEVKDTKEGAVWNKKGWEWYWG
jgi:hypothetical protein